MDPIKISFKVDDKVVWCPRGPNVNITGTSSSSMWHSVPPNTPIVVNSTITTNATSTSWNQPVMCTGIWGPTRPPRRGLEGVVLQEGEEHGAPYVQVQFGDGWIDKITYPEGKIRLLKGCSFCPYRLYRITGECPGDPDLIRNEGRGV